MNAEMDDILRSSESLDRASPDLWPDHHRLHHHHDKHHLHQQQPQNGSGFSGGDEQAGSYSSGSSSPILALKEFTQQDAKLFHEYANLTAVQMIEEVKQLQNVAYLLGLDEAKEMRRGKYLNILRKSS